MSIDTLSVLDVRLINGPGVQVDRTFLHTLVAQGCEALPVNLHFESCADEVELLRELDRPRSTGDAIVVNAGLLLNSPSVASAVEVQRVPLVWVDLRDAMEKHPPRAPRDVMRVRGRGIKSYAWAIRRLVQHATWPPQLFHYGPGKDEVADLRMPVDIRGRAPVAVFLHGGSWREAWERDTIEPLAIDLAGRGFATWNVEYRRVGPSGGGWPTTCRDVASALDKLRELSSTHALDLERVIFVGHSAGGHLALWAARRRGLPSDGRPGLTPRLIVSLAGIPDLVECAKRGLGDGGNIAAGFMGARYDERPDEYALASPAESLPLGTRQLLVQGLADEWPDLVDLNRMYRTRAQSAGDEVELLEVEGANHFDVIDPNSAAWEKTLERINVVVEPEAR